MTKLELVTLDKSLVTTITNQIVFGWKRKINKVKFHPLTNCMHIIILQLTRE
jgi:hypothetical protein